MRTKRILTVIAGMIVLSPIFGCAQTGPGGASCAVLGPKAAVGIIGGALAGGAIGAAASHDNPKLALLGALVGGIAGGFVGGHLDKEDCDAAQAALRQMDNAKVGDKISWNNPKSGNSGAFTPLSQPEDNAGRVCREYKRDVTMSDGKQTAGDVGVVCRNSDGDWVVASK